MIVMTICIYCFIPIDLRMPILSTERVNFVCPACCNLQTVDMKDMILYDGATGPRS